MSYKELRISTDVLAMLFGTNSTQHYRVVSGLPERATLISVDFDSHNQCVNLLYKSPDFANDNRDVEIVMEALPCQHYNDDASSGILSKLIERRAINAAATE